MTDKKEKEQQDFCLSAFIRAERQMLRKLGDKKRYTLMCDGWILTIAEPNHEEVKLDLRIASQFKYDKELGGITFISDSKEKILWFDTIEFANDDNVHFLGLHEWKKGGKIA